MKKIYTLFALLFLATSGLKAQISLQYNDTTLCPGQTITMCASLTGLADALNSDDQSSGIINLGFPFVFFGNTYTKCVASGNGMINFDTTLANTGWGWTWGQITGGTNPVANEAIFATFCDLFLPSGGQIRYQRLGSVGQRKFIIEWCQVPVYSGACASAIVTTQIVLYEGSNLIEIHTTNLPAIGPSCPSASPGYYQQVVQGVRNSDGSASFFPTNRDPVVSTTNWAVTGLANDAVRFTPTSNTNYTITPIPFNPFPIIDSVYSDNLKWYAPNTTTPFATGACATTTVLPGVNYYTVHYDGIAGCQADSAHLIDTVHILYGAKYDTLNVDICVGSTYNFYGHALHQTGQYDTTFSTVGGCDSVITLNLSVNPYPIVSLTDTTSRVILCRDVNGTIALSNPASNYSYQWYRNDSLLTGQTASSISSSIPGAYKVAVTTDKGCSSVSQTVHFETDAIHVDFNIDLFKGCVNDTIRLTNLSTVNSTYKWNFGDGTFPPDTTLNPTHIYQTQNVYFIKLIATDTNGCVDSTLKQVNTLHPLNAAFTSSADTICLSEGAPVVFTDQSVGATSWNWNFGEGSPVNTQNASYTFTQHGAHNVRLVIHDDIPCYDTVYHIVQVDSVPYFSIAQDKHVMCAGEQLDFTSDFYATTLRSISWNFGDGSQWNQSGATSHHYENPGIYWINVDADFGVCGISHAMDSIVVNAFPIVDLGPDSVLCLNASAIRVADLHNTGDPSIQWAWNTGATTPFIEVNTPGTYSVTATKNDCSTTESITINKDCYNDIPNVFTPNGDGVNDYFYPKQLLSKGVVGFSMTVFDRWGQKVFESNTPNGRGWDGKFNNKVQPMGVYIYQMSVVMKNGRTEEFTGNVTLVR
ncbi:PKD domain-containing protein [Taibaiella lutea]|uniref:PKD domain-containing protein n=1 Tax=Taibaiella lutea TaxID=2608001 RepID=A0A5M6CFU9_9BACT|nr:gliding motility-associated C-terminal domain-containing protein [Taibaiella lutea]KAA5533320.1 PKD domain-containing protein [Taibaiella lutea]